MARRVYQVQRISAVILLVLLLVHTHFVRHMPLDRPLWKAADIAFLFTMLLHGLTGAYVIVSGMTHAGALKRALAALAILIGVGAFLYGAGAIIAFQPPEAAALAGY